MNALIVIWPAPSVRPSMVLAVEYHPPMRPVRKAPPSIRTASADDRQTAQLVDLIGSLPTRKDRP